MKNLFAYGTLMCPDILQAVTGKIFKSEKAVLNNFARHLVKQEIYPGLIKNKNEKVEGIVYFNIPDDVWEKLDFFEGEMYFKQNVDIKIFDGTIINAVTYVTKSKFANQLENYDWEYNSFIQNHKNSFLKNL